MGSESAAGQTPASSPPQQAVLTKLIAEGITE